MWSCCTQTGEGHPPEGGAGVREEGGGGRGGKSIESNRTETAGTHSQAHYSRHSTYWQNAAQ